MKHSARLLPILSVALGLSVSQMFFSGCATIANGPNEEIKFESQPAGAVVSVNGKAIGRTPTAVVISRWSSPRIRIEMAGFKPYELLLEKRMTFNAAGNVLLGGGPVVIDALTGSLFAFDVSEAQQREFGKGSHVSMNEDRILYISVVLKPQRGARKIGQLEPR